jgi:nicotinate-nucleotide pyrophosphorylase (carboxylating)
MDRKHSDFIPKGEEVEKQVAFALEEDIGAGDLTALLIPEEAWAKATVVVRESAILCGTPWFSEVFRQLDERVAVTWHKPEGGRLNPGEVVVELFGPARALLTGERSALNFLQTLSAVATETARFVEAVAGTQARIVDTRKTLPGLRQALKYAVRVGGGTNHRMGLYDGILIKENHIAAAGSIAGALARAKAIAPPEVFIQVEVETLEQLKEALDHGATMILLDNMTSEQHQESVRLNAGRAILEISGGVTLDTVRELALTGVDRISIGHLTKDIKATDYSMRFQIDE